jgi:hypothetical protein
VKVVGFAGSGLFKVIISPLSLSLCKKLRPAVARSERFLQRDQREQRELQITLNRLSLSEGDVLNLSD